uniref:Integrase core domain containing protein n=1 Tax=Angiostrongylus cantonensis TaxID=6313 RepID=A0A0K0DNR6_ANGCA
MRMNDNRWKRAVGDWVSRNVTRTAGKPPTRWPEFFTKSLEEGYDARRVPKASRTHWTTLARDREKWRIYWRPLESLDDQRDYSAANGSAPLRYGCITASLWLYLTSYLGVKNYGGQEIKEGPESLIDLLMDAQGRRMDEQRAALLSDFTSRKRTLELMEELGSISEDGVDTKIEEALINLLMNAQEQRMNDQRSDLVKKSNNFDSRGSLQSTSTERELPVMVMRTQVKRVEDQCDHRKRPTNLEWK